MPTTLLHAGLARGIHDVARFRPWLHAPRPDLNLSLFLVFLFATVAVVTAVVILGFAQSWWVLGLVFGFHAVVSTKVVGMVQRYAGDGAPPET